MKSTESGGVGIDPTSKLYSEYGGQQKYLAAKKAFDDAKKKFTNQEQKLKDANKIIEELLNAPDGLYAQYRAALAADNQPLMLSLSKEIGFQKDKRDDNLLKINALDKKIQDAQAAFEKKKIKNNSGGGGNDTVKSGTPGKGPWNFNAPLVSSSAFLNMGELPEMLSGGYSSVGNASTFWNNVYVQSNGFGGVENLTIPGKGTFQMDRLTNTTELKANAKKEAAKNKIQFDDKMYGFRFQYNPTTVNMSWSGVRGANPVYEAAGLDPAVPLAQSLITGTVSFDIILNRIQDLALLNDDGSYKQGSNPYPWEVSLEDRKTIVEKGTMYDLEYFFRTMHGYAFYTNFKSTLMGQTNDPGWLPVRPVELHLGNKLRYRVAVGGLEVVHKVFSKRMIPILSVVTLSCNRYWDGPPQKDGKLVKQ